MRILASFILAILFLSPSWVSANEHCAADLNGDGVVNAADLAILLGSWGPCPESCDDGAQNQDETDVDCGGSICPPCPAGSGCVVGTDCQSEVCSEGVCQECEPEVCDGEDNDCDGDIDEGKICPIWCPDADGDDYGDPSNPVQACEPPPGHVGNCDDCDDGSADCHPDGYPITCCDDQCVDLENDPNHCGECNFPCAGGENCVNGQCE